MTGCQRIEAAFSDRGTDRFASVVCYPTIFIRDHHDGLTRCPWWYAMSPRIEDRLAYHRDMIVNSAIDWYSVPTGPSHEERQSQVIEVRGGQVVRIDRRTGGEQILQRPPVSGLHLNIRAGTKQAEPPDNQAAIDAVIPEPADPDGTLFEREGRHLLAQQLARELGAEKFPVAAVGAPLWFCFLVWGFEATMTMIAERPDLMDYAVKRQLRHSLATVQAARRLGAKAVWIEDCLSDLIGPEAFARHNVASIRPIVEAIAAAGMRSIYYFCGNPAGKWDLLMDVGSDALGLEESKKTFVIDIDEVVERVAGRRVVFGNLDAVNVLGSADEAVLKREIARQIEAGRRNKGRFVMSTGSPVTPGTSVGRVRRYCEMVREVGG